MSEKTGGALRDSMPGVTAFIDVCRDVFGKVEVDDWIRAGIEVGGFWAEENGRTVGVRQDMTGDRTSLAQWLEGTKTIELDRIRRQAKDDKGPR